MISILEDFGRIKVLALHPRLCYKTLPRGKLVTDPQTKQKVFNPLVVEDLHDVIPFTHPETDTKIGATVPTLHQIWVDVSTGRLFEVIAVTEELCGEGEVMLSPYKAPIAVESFIVKIWRLRQNYRVIDCFITRRKPGSRGRLARPRLYIVKNK